MGKGCASVFGTHLTNGKTLSSENNKYKYFNVSAIQNDSILSLNTIGVWTTVLKDKELVSCPQFFRNIFDNISVLHNCEYIVDNTDSACNSRCLAQSAHTLTRQWL